LKHACVAFASSSMALLGFTPAPRPPVGPADGGTTIDAIGLSAAEPLESKPAAADGDLAAETLEAPRQSSTPYVSFGSEAVAHMWFAEHAIGDACNSEWRPLRREDQRKLEEAWASEDRPRTVIVDGGRAEVQLADGLLVDRYGASPPRPPAAVRRSLWLRREPGRGGGGAGVGAVATGWQPYEEAADAALEAAYQELVSSAKEAAEDASKPALGAHLATRVQLPLGKVAVQLKLKPSLGTEDQSRKLQLQAEERAASWWEAGPSLLGRSIAVCRGLPADCERWEEGEAEEAALAEEAERVVVLVHRGSAAGSLAQTFRCNMHRCQLLLAGFEQAPGDSGPWVHVAAPDAPARVRRDEVIEVAWSQEPQQSSFEQGLRQLTLPAGTQAREAANTALTDALLYAQPERREGMLAGLAEAVEGAVAAFKSCRPGFSGSIFLVGHGLEAAMLFQLLREERLSFAPKVLFAVGSPLPALLQLAGDVARLDGSFELPHGTRMVNVFHPLDLRAYRLEPLLAPMLSQHLAEQVPSEARFIARRLLDCDTKGVALALNRGARIDWALQGDLATGQGGVAEGEGPSEVCGLPSLSPAAYLRSQEVANFVQVASATIASWGTDGSLEDFLSEDAAWNPLPPMEEEQEGSSSLAAFSMESMRRTGEQLKLSASSGARGLSEGLSKRWEETGAKAAVSGAADVMSRKCKEAGATDVVVGTYQAAAGAVGVARAVGGTVRLVGGAVGAAGGVVNIARAAMNQKK